jgi:hypothetical protein
MVERLTEVSRVLPLDTMGHLLCTYDETGHCECSTLPERLAAHDEAIRADQAERIAVAFQTEWEKWVNHGHGVHIDDANHDCFEMFKALTAIARTTDTKAVE